MLLVTILETLTQPTRRIEDRGGAGQAFHLLSTLNVASGLPQISDMCSRDDVRSDSAPIFGHFQTMTTNFVAAFGLKHHHNLST